ncbi:hypothetical protein LMG18090_00824 [Ralstonia mannitolilytica]|jgi:hypothetical protein|uniref:DUF2924 domain-containing protein n=1 Tax=Ralstonia TaxID=48736 RepID=UPI000468303E|nr:MULTISPECIES: DUF2924 domain-containing protein [Ralstonia]CAJ0777487.1 hypothetical protein LMG18090_00824 [Ralstonia mannitolilytica]CAJ0895562.1 hypothetical protein R6138_03910 [Ralstonia sp. LMG 18095]
MSIDLSELVAMDRAALAKRWQQMFDHPAPTKCRVEFLRQALGWQMQAAVFGGLSASDRRRLLRGTSSAAPKLATGSHLIRVWQGDTHQVTVLEDGYWYAGKRWRSLSSIAKAITGTSWSGPVFFGIKP